MKYRGCRTKKGGIAPSDGSIYSTESGDRDEEASCHPPPGECWKVGLVRIFEGVNDE
jgi:hypothetical protein